MFLCTRSPAVVVAVVVVVAIVARHGEAGMSERSGSVASCMEKTCVEDNKRVHQAGVMGAIDPGRGACLWS